MSDESNKIIFAHASALHAALVSDPALGRRLIEAFGDAREAREALDKMLTEVDRVKSETAETPRSAEEVDRRHRQEGIAITLGLTADVVAHLETIGVDPETFAKIADPQVREFLLNKQPKTPGVKELAAAAYNEVADVEQGVAAQARRAREEANRVVPVPDPNPGPSV
jgi:hypothetical protein